MSVIPDSARSTASEEGLERLLDRDAIDVGSRAAATDAIISDGFPPVVHRPSPFARICFRRVEEDRPEVDRSRTED